MAEVKLGDRVKVEFEGTVTYVDDEETEVGGYTFPSEATVTLLPADEPTGVGAVAKVTYPDHVYYSDYLAVRTSDGLWYSSANMEESWDDLFQAEGSVEILSQGVDIAP